MGSDSAEVREKLTTSHPGPKKGDFWLGMGLSLILNFILWKLGSYIMNLDYVNENYNFLLYKTEYRQLPFGSFILNSLCLFGIFINGAIMALMLFKRRFLIFLGMASVIPIAFALYVLLLIFVFIYWGFFT